MGSSRHPLDSLSFWITVVIMLVGMVVLFNI